MRCIARGSLPTRRKADAISMSLYHCSLVLPIEFRALSCGPVRTGGLETTVWRWGQSRANPSLLKFPDNPRFTGKFCEITGNSRQRIGYSHAFSIGCERIPYLAEQGIF